MTKQASSPAPAPDVARLFHLHSAHERERALVPEIDPHAQPMRFRTYPGAPRVPLPGRDFEVSMSLGEALARRKSVRELELRPLPLASLGRLLHASYGVRGHRKIAGEHAYDRPAPSAGGRYPLELYVSLREVESVEDGVYHYDARAHELERILPGAIQTTLADLALGQDVMARANVSIVITAVRDRTMWKYGQRGYRYLWLDAGHVGQNVYLVATAMGLGPTAVGGFFDDEVNALLSLPDDEEAMYLLAVGQVAEGG